MDEKTPPPDRQKAPIVLVPGFWLGAWAWDEVARPLRQDGHPVEAVTLPGLADLNAQRPGIGLAEHIAAVVEVVRSLGPGVVLVGHSGGGAVVHGVTDAIPDHLGRAIYVDSGPLPEGTALNPDLDPSIVEIPLPSWADLEASGSSLQGLDETMKEEFRRRAVPHPASAARDRLRLSNPNRREVPVTLITSSFRVDQVKRLAMEGHPFFSELTHLQVDYVDLPTGHWPMWSRPADLAIALAQASRALRGSPGRSA